MFTVAYLCKELMILEKDKNKLLHIIYAIRPDVTVYLFGSQATGTAREHSDIDLALEAREPISRFEIAEMKSMIEASRLLTTVDIVDINSVDELFKNEIIATRIPWKL